MESTEPKPFYYRQILEQIDDSVILTDLSGDIIFVCKNIHIVFGFASDEIFEFKNIKNLLGQEIYDFIHFKNLNQFSNFELEIIDKHHKSKTILASIKRVDIEYPCWLITCHDISDIKQIQKKIPEAEKRYRRIFESLKMLVLIIDHEGYISFANQSFTDLCGIDFESINNHPVSEFLFKLPDDDSASFLDNFGEIQPMEHFHTMVLSKKLEKHYISWWTAITRDDRGRISRLTFLGQDVTQEKMNEIDLLKLKTAVDQSPMSVVITNLEGNIIFINPYFTKITGYTEDEAIGRNPRILKSNLHEKEYYKELWNTISTGGIWHGQFCNFRKDGTIYWEQASIGPVVEKNGKIINYIALKFDITEQKIKEKALTESEERFRNAILFAPFPIMIYSEDGQIVQVNNLWCELTGYTQELIPDYGTWSSTILKIEEDDRSDLIKTLFESRKPLYEGEYMIYTSSGNPNFWSIYSAPLGVDNAGKRLVISMAIDITTKLAAQEKIRLSEEELRSTFEEAQIGIAHLDTDGKWIKINKKLESILEYSLKELHRTDIFKITHPEEAFLERENFSKTIKGQIDTYSCEKRIINAQNQEVWVNQTISRIKNYANQTKYLVATLDDITFRKKAEQSLVKSEKKYRSLLEGLNEGILMIDKDGLVQYANDKLALMLEYSVDELCDHLIYDFFDPETKEKSKHVLQQRLHGASESHDFIFISKGKRAVYTLVETSVIHDENDNVQGLLAGVVDISHRLEIEMQLKFETLLNKIVADLSRALLSKEHSIRNISEMVLEKSMELTGSQRGFACIFDKTKKIEPSQIYTKSLRSKCNKFEGQWDEEEYSLSLPELDINTIKSTLSNEKGSHPLIQWIMRGNPFIENYLIVPSIANENRVGFIIMADNADNYTPIHKEALERIADIFALSILRKQYDNEIVISKEAALEASSVKSEFLANISHEIRTPMNIILGYSEILSKKLQNESELFDLSRSLVSSSQSLLHLINEILDYSKIEANRVEINFEEINLPLLIEEFYSVFQLKAKERGLEFIIILEDSCPEFIVSDGIRIRQILFNLLGNAFKFTERGSVSLKVSAFYTDHQCEIQFQITDSGIGISEKQQKLIFEPFRQQDGQDTRKYGGTGLGLSITKRLVELLNGNISLSSEVNSGSTFTVKIPGLSFKNGRKFSKSDIYMESGHEKPISIYDQINLDDSISLLSNEGIKVLQKLFHDAQSTMSIDLIKLFAETLMNQANQNQLSDLEIIGKKLFQKTTDLNLQSINEIMQYLEGYFG